ncbi:hypothetical protein ACQY0O_006104 [Thecaphora frezii]
MNPAPLRSLVRTTKQPLATTLRTASCTSALTSSPLSTPLFPRTSRPLSTTSTTMSLFRPGSLFTSPFFSDFDTFPFVSTGSGGRHSGFPNLPAPTDFFRSDSFSGPRVDLHEEETAYKLTAELPGYKKEDIQISVDEARRRLTLTGQLRSEYSTASDTQQQQQQQDGGEKAASKEVATKSTEGRVGHPLISERIYGSFSRSFTLPTNANLADEKALKARFQDGLLRLEIPKKAEEATKARQITIEAE